MAIKINGQDLLKRYINGQEIVRVYKNRGQIRPETVPPVFDDYLCFTAEQSNSTVTLNLMGTSTIRIEISRDRANRQDYTVTTPIVLTNVGDKVYMRNKLYENGISSSTTRYHYFSMTGKIGASGNINYLAHKDGTPEYIKSYGFYNLFSGCTSLTKAPTLPSTTVNQYGYSGMFNGCTSLVVAPALPATTLGKSSYSGMFSGCTSLTTPPSTLPTTAISDYTYHLMFRDCVSLNTAPVLYTSTMSGYASCYGMFMGCTSLTTPPALPATTLAQECYGQMFNGCSSLSKMPALNATELARACYEYMFYNCPLIKLSETQGGEYQTEYRIPTVGDGISAFGWGSYMFSGTGGTFTGTPSINTTYYTSNQVI